MTPKHNSLLWALTLSLFFLHSHSAAYNLASLLNPNTAAFKIEGKTSAGAFGISVSNGGDINGGGIDDIIIGAPYASSSRGEIYVIYGSADSTFSDMTVNGLPQASGFRVIGNAAGDCFGASVSSAGDLDKDNFDDIIVGAPSKNGNTGAVYIIFGATYTAHLDIDLSTTSLYPTTSGFMIIGSAAGDLFGASVSSAGDVNHDGFADIIIGAPGKNGGKGAAYVIYGKPKGSLWTVFDLSTTSLDPATTGFTITGNAAGDRLGYAVGPAGDVNNDGNADIVIGAPGKNGNTGSAYVIYGKLSFSSSYSNLDPTTLDPATTGFGIGGKQPLDMFGSSCGNAGDMNNDGKNEIFVAAKQGNMNQGEVSIIYGQASASLSNIDLSTTVLVPTSTGFTITGDATSGGFGFSVAPAGDVTGDGYADIIIGALSETTVYVIYGGSTASRQDVPLASTTLDPLVNGFAIAGLSSSAFGYSVSIAGGFELNGETGLLVGAPQASSYGDAYVIFPSSIFLFRSFFE